MAREEQVAAVINKCTAEQRRCRLLINLFAATQLTGLREALTHPLKAAHRRELRLRYPQRLHWRWPGRLQLSSQPFLRSRRRRVLRWDCKQQQRRHWSCNSRCRLRLRCSRIGCQHFPAGSGPDLTIGCFTLKAAVAGSRPVPPSTRLSQPSANPEPSAAG